MERSPGGRIVSCATATTTRQAQATLSGPGRHSRTIISSASGARHAKQKFGVREALSIRNPVITQKRRSRGTSRLLLPAYMHGRRPPTYPQKEHSKHTQAPPPSFLAFLPRADDEEAGPDVEEERDLARASSSDLASCAFCLSTSRRPGSRTDTRFSRDATTSARGPTT